MPSQAFKEFHNNRIDVSKLIEAHTLLHNGGRGRKGLGHITRSGIVMLCACFELYIETVLIESLDVFTSRVGDINTLPKAVLKHLSAKVKNDLHELRPIHLAGNGWKNVYKSYAEQDVLLLNTPKTGKIDELFKHYLGYEDFSSNWGIDKKVIDLFVSKRGEIAHKGRAARYIKIGELVQDLDLFTTLVSTIDQLLLDYIRNKTPGNIQPWNRTY